MKEGNNNKTDELLNALLSLEVPEAPEYPEFNREAAKYKQPAALKYGIPALQLLSYISSATSGNETVRRNAAGETAQLVRNYINKLQQKGAEAGAKAEFDYRNARDRAVFEANAAQDAYRNKLNMIVRQREFERGVVADEYTKALTDKIGKPEEKDPREEEINELTLAIKNMQYEKELEKAEAERAKIQTAETEAKHLDVLADNFSTREEALQYLDNARKGYTERNEGQPVGRGKKMTPKNKKSRMKFSEYRYWLRLINELFPTEEGQEWSKRTGRKGSEYHSLPEGSETDDYFGD